MATVRFKIVAFKDGEKEPYRTTEIINHRGYEVDNTVEEMSTFINDTWGEAQEEEGYED